MVYDGDARKTRLLFQLAVINTLLFKITVVLLTYHIGSY